MNDREKESWWWFGAAVIGGLAFDSGLVFLGIMAVHIAYGMGKMKSYDREKTDSTNREARESRRSVLIAAIVSVIFWLILLALGRR